MLISFFEKIAEGISFCPYCGERLTLVSVVRATTCARCNKSFTVVVDREVESDLKLCANQN